MTTTFRPPPRRTKKASSPSFTRCSSKAGRPRRDQGQDLARPPAHQPWRSVRRLDRRRPKKAEILVVVMSPNWMDRPYCRKELDAFVELRRAAGSPTCRYGWSWSARATSTGAAAAAVAAQEGFLFYARDDQNDVADVTPFFNRGEVCDAASTIGGTIWRVPADGAWTPRRGRGHGRRRSGGQPIVTPNGRTIFLAKPAPDMKAAYARLRTSFRARASQSSGRQLRRPQECGRARLLQRRAREGRSLRPSRRRQAGICAGRCSTRSSSCSLTRAREKAGGEREPPSRLSAGSSGRRNSSTKAARRPPAGRRARSAPSSGTLRQPDRDRQDRRRHSEQIRRIPVPVPGRDRAAAPASAARRQQARRLSLLPLRRRGLCRRDRAGAARRLGQSPRIPVAGSDAESRRYNGDLLAKCDGVTLCWANASEVWVRSEADRLSDWQALGRKEQFAFRGLIAGSSAGRAQEGEHALLIFPGRRVRQSHRSRREGSADRRIARRPHFRADRQAMNEGR